jgi:hypothetical protein
MSSLEMKSYENGWLSCRFNVALKVPDREVRTEAGSDISVACKANVRNRMIRDREMRRWKRETHLLPMGYHPNSNR